MSYNLFGTPTPTLVTGTPGNSTLGTVFTSLIPGQITGVRFYKGALNIGTHIGTLWSIGGSNLAQVTFTGETASGWQTMSFGSPYTILANTQYVITYSVTAVLNYTAGAAAINGQPLANPLGAPASFGCYIVGSANVFPTHFNDANTYWVDAILDNVTVPAGQRDLIGRQCVVGALQGVCIGGLTSIHGDTFDRHLQVGVREELVDGYPSPPCLALDIPGFWRFKWQIIPGSQTISCYAKQVSNLAGYRPTLVIKKNPLFGVGSDTIGVAPSGTGWVKIGPLTVVATQPGVLYCELHNNDTQTFQSTAYFDNMDK